MKMLVPVFLAKCVRTAAKNHGGGQKKTMTLENDTWCRLHEISA